METFNHFPQAADEFNKAVGQCVRKAAFDLQGLAVSIAPVDTGNLRNSIYVKTNKENNYPGNASHDIVDDQVPDVDQYTAYVAVGAAYGIYQEMGTRFMPPHPFLAPAADQYRGTFESVFERLEDLMKGL